jgi:methanogenic corrinoid protein MtbC1
MSTPDRVDLAATDPRTLSRVLEAVRSEIIPRMYLAHRVGPVPPSLGLAVGRRLTDADQAEFLRRVRGASEGSAAEQVRELVANGVPVEAVMLDLLTPAARHLGEEWEHDTCDFVEVTVALGRMQRVMRSLGVVASDEGSGAPVGRALLTTMRAEQHSLGLLMVAEFFLRTGWDVTLGHPVEPIDLEDAVARGAFDIVGISVSVDARLTDARQLIERLRRRSRNPALAVMVGGPLFLADPSLAARLGADGWAPDAASAPALAVRLAGLGTA